MRNYVSTINPFFDLFFNCDTKTNHMMETDIKEYKDRYEMKINLPSVNKEDIKLTLEEGYLKVEVTYNENVEEKEEAEYIYKERKSGSYHRSYFVGKDVKYDHITAKLDKGVLTLNIKKVEPEKEEAHYINID